MDTQATPTPTSELMHGIFTTALEGGINYWTGGTWRYHWCHDSDRALDTIDYDGFYAEIEYDADADGVTLSQGVVAPSATRVMIDRSVVSRGYRLATSAKWRGKLGWSSENPPLVVTADSDWDYDAGDADMVVQLGLFGDVVYG